MTYDELLAEVKLRQGMEMGLYAFKAWLALSAVVELHKPHPISTTESMKDGKWQSNIHCDDCHSVYPCPTIQAIEKELK